MSTTSIEQEEDFSFPVCSSSAFIESPRLHWRRVPSTANSTPITKLELLKSKYQRRSFSYMENDSSQMMNMMMMRTQDDINKMDLLWEDLHELPKTSKYCDNDDDEEEEEESESSDLEKLRKEKKRGLSILPVRRIYETVANLKVLKKLFYVRKIGSSRSI